MPDFKFSLKSSFLPLLFLGFGVSSIALADVYCEDLADRIVRLGEQVDAAREREEAAFRADLSSRGRAGAGLASGSAFDPPRTHRPPVQRPSAEISADLEGAKKELILKCLSVEALVKLPDAELMAAAIKGEAGFCSARKGRRHCRYRIRVGNEGLSNRRGCHADLEEAAAAVRTALEAGRCNRL